MAKRKALRALKKQRFVERRSHKKIVKFAKHLDSLRNILDNSSAKEVEVILKRSVYGRKADQVKTLEALGFRKKINSTKKVILNDCTKGMIRKVLHLVDVKEL